MGVRLRRHVSLTALPVLFSLFVVLGLGLYAALSLWLGGDDAFTPSPTGEVVVGEGLSYSSPDRDHIRSGASSVIEYVDNEVVVYVEEGVSKGDVIDLVEKHAGGSARIVGEAEVARCFQVRFDGARNLAEIEAICEDLAKSVGVIGAVPQYCASLSGTSPTGDPVWTAETPEGRSSMTWGIDAIRAPEAWELVKVDRSSHIGLIDTQFYADHEDLDDAFVDGIGLSEAQFAVEDIAVDEFGNKSSVRDVHGTHVAGIVGAEANGVGSVGIAHDASLYGYAVAGNDSQGNPKITASYDLSVSLFYLVSMCDCTVVNMSVEDEDMVKALCLGDGAAAEEARRGLKGYADSFELAINALVDAGFKEFVICKASGNQGEIGARADMGMLGMIEDATASSRIIVVGALEQDNGGSIEKSTSTSGGSRVDVWAPGYQIYNAVYDVDWLGRPVSDYDYLGGSSMATPMVSGVAALVQAADPDLTGDQVKEVIVQTRVSGTDMVDARAAVERASAHASGSLGDSSSQSESTKSGSSGTSESSSSDLGTGWRRGAHRLFLWKLEELECEYGRPGYTSQGNSGDSWRAAYATGVCFADILDFGDGVERLVTLHLNMTTDKRPMDFWPDGEDYTFDVWEYDEGNDELRNVVSGPLTGGTTGDYDFGYNSVKLGLGIEIDSSTDAIEYRIVVVSGTGRSMESPYQNADDVSGIDIRSMEEAAQCEKETMRELRDEFGE